MIDVPNRQLIGLVPQTGNSGFNTAKEQAKALGTEWFQAFFCVFYP